MKKPVGLLRFRADDRVSDVARRFGGEETDYLPLHRWFLETASWANTPAHLIFRHHAFGIYEAEHRFGPAIDNGASGAPTRVVAEQHVRTMLGRMPAAPDFLHDFVSADLFGDGRAFFIVPG